MQMMMDTRRFFIDEKKDEMRMTIYDSVEYVSYFAKKEYIESVRGEINSFPEIAVVFDLYDQLVMKCSEEEILQDVFDEVRSIVYAQEDEYEIQKSMNYNIVNEVGEDIDELENKYFHYELQEEYVQYVIGKIVYLFYEHKSNIRKSNEEDAYKTEKYHVSRKGNLSIKKEIIRPMTWAEYEQRLKP